MIPRLDAKHVYSQVPAIAGASDHGLLDLLGVTADGRLAVIELKVDDDLLRQINCIASIVIATVPNFSFAKQGQRIARPRQLGLVARRIGVRGRDARRRG